jgi:hypothetical protein
LSFFDAKELSGLPLPCTGLRGEEIEEIQDLDDVLSGVPVVVAVTRATMQLSSDGRGSSRRSFHRGWDEISPLIAVLSGPGRVVAVWFDARGIALAWSWGG